ncbi:hypothetical protein [Nocardia anaemiae]|uniref:hypothetical protein n=1 Tax=Nocardia anaemiae TaxID=263910 RepID=UPI000ADCB5D7|nr:hypothetical protein [Nocardia anaemiae]
MAEPVKQHMLDRLLRVAVDRAAAPSGIRFTERQLYYELCRLLTPMHRAPRRFTFTVPAPLSYATFRAALDRLEFPGLLIPTPPRTTRAGLHTPEPDLFDYGLPRLLVCESDAIAQMLRANGLPMESACPVLSASELPLDPGIAQMLTRADGTIYLLHDASPHGLTFPARLTDLTEIPEKLRVVPLGLRPRQVATLHLPHLRAPIPTSLAAQVDPRERDEPRAGAARMDSGERAGLYALEPSTRATQLDSWERAWLHHGRFVEVEAVRPASLLRTVHRLVRDIHPPRTALPELRRARTTGFMTWPTA